MTLIPKLDRYLLSKFLPIFVGAFFICLFVFMMQFTWRYVDELVGKGLSMEILAQFFWYMGETLVPQALPLAVLLASLITFGNLGESFELLAMKAAGAPLLRIMRPMLVIAIAISGVSFYFQNKTSPEAQVNLRTLLFSMKQQSPAVEIPEGVFYNGVPDINIFVQKKNAETGMLYQTIIYKTDQGFDRAQIVLADSARLEITADKKHIRLELWNGEQFESLESSSGARMLGSGADQPYDRETFQFKSLLIDFDSNFNMMDKDMLLGMPQAKTMKEIDRTVDSLTVELDSLGKRYYEDAIPVYYKHAKVSDSDSAKLVKLLAEKSMRMQADTLMAQVPADRMRRAHQAALSQIKSIHADLEWKKTTTSQTRYYILAHQVVWHQKITYALACLIFFFVGAPLGAIIRKGGLGMPTVISVMIFIIWYIIDTSGMKMARDGNINMVAGMWASTFLIAPFAVFITYKANKDSVVFNKELYQSLLYRVLGLRSKRHIFAKEVIIDNPRPEVMKAELIQLREACEEYRSSRKLVLAPGYVNTFFRHVRDTEVEEINARMEAIVEELSNSRNKFVLSELNKLPLLFVYAHTSPFSRHWLNVAAGLLFPIGVVLWFRIWRFRLVLNRDMKVIARTSNRLIQLIDGETIDEVEEEDEEAGDAVPKAKRRHRRARILLLVVAAVMGVAIAFWGGKHFWARYQMHKHKAPETIDNVNGQAPEPFLKPVKTIR